ncbi:MAG: hypothetical protein ACMUIE_03195 [Thermoplasmatota archaeon]
MENGVIVMKVQLEMNTRIKRDERGIFLASCPELGLCGEGLSEEEAVEELKRKTYNLLVGSIIDDNGLT